MPERPPPAPPAPAVLETALYAEDLTTAEGFYGKVLGLDVMFRKPGRHVFFRVPGGVLLVFRASATMQASPDDVPAHGAVGPGHVCFAADAKALAGWEARLEAFGIKIETRVSWPNGARSVYVRDPAGNSVEFAEPHLWG